VESGGQDEAIVERASADGRATSWRAPNVQRPISMDDRGQRLALDENQAGDEPGREKSCNAGGVSPFNLTKRAAIGDESRSAPRINREGKWDGRKKRRPGAGCVVVTTGWR
jgi:hypothetical protein